MFSDCSVYLSRMSPGSEREVHAYPTYQAATRKLHLQEDELLYVLFEQASLVRINDTREKIIVQRMYAFYPLPHNTSSLRTGILHHELNVRSCMYVVNELYLVRCLS